MQKKCNLCGRTGHLEGFGGWSGGRGEGEKEEGKKEEGGKKEDERREGGKKEGGRRDACHWVLMNSTTCLTFQSV